MCSFELGLLAWFWFVLKGMKTPFRRPQDRGWLEPERFFRKNQPTCRSAFGFFNSGFWKNEGEGMERASELSKELKELTCPLH